MRNKALHLTSQRRSLSLDIRPQAGILYIGFILATVLCVSCSTIRKRESHPEATGDIALPKLALDGVAFDDGLQEQEVLALSPEYFRRFVSGCGMPDKPEDRKRFWCVQLWGGFIAVDYGRLWLAKDGTTVFLEPPRGGLKSGTRAMLKHQNINYE